MHECLPELDYPGRLSQTMLLFDSERREAMPGLPGTPARELHHGRLLPTCDLCDGAGTVPRTNNEKTSPEGGSLIACRNS
jgi:hypothetical protein